MFPTIAATTLVALLLATAALSDDGGVDDGNQDQQTLTRCGLAAQLKQLGVPQSDIATWVCIANYESGYNTAAVGQHNGNTYYGIFQIVGQFWCSPGGNACHVDCANLHNSNIGDDVTCARQIKAGSGFGAWSTYGDFCSGGRAATFVQGCAGF